MENLVIYQNGEIELKVSIENETIWLKAEDIASLFDVQRPAIVKHIGNIYKTNELAEFSTCSILEQVAKDAKKRKIKTRCRLRSTHDLHLKMADAPKDSYDKPLNKLYKKRANLINPTVKKYLTVQKEGSR